KRRPINSSAESVENSTLKLFAHTDVRASAGRFQNVALAHAVDFTERHGNHFSIGESNDLYRHAIALTLEPAHASHRHVRTMRFNRVSDDLLDEPELCDRVGLLKTFIESLIIQHAIS